MADEWWSCTRAADDDDDAGGSPCSTAPATTDQLDAADEPAATSTASIDFRRPTSLLHVVRHAAVPPSSPLILADPPHHIDDWTQAYL
jgi:hypothetical protein